MRLKFKAKFCPSLDRIVSLQWLTLLVVESPGDDNKKVILFHKLFKKLMIIIFEC